MLRLRLWHLRDAHVINGPLAKSWLTGDQFSLCSCSGWSRSADEWVSWSFVQVVFETSIIAEGGSPNLQDCFGPVWIVPEHFSAFDS